MACKRKFVEDASNVEPNTAKQMKLVPFPSAEQMSCDMDVDMTMTDSPITDIDPYQASFQNTLPFHTRLTSSASTTSIDASSDCTSDASSSSDPTETNNTQPSLNGRSYSALGFPHLRPGCKQIPKLRVACSNGVSGCRSMWGICEECGAIQMLDS